MSNKATEEYIIMEALYVSKGDNCNRELRISRFSIFRPLPMGFVLLDKLFEYHESQVSQLENRNYSYAT